MAEILRFGASGDTVRALQTLLNGLGGYGLSVDGQFDARTRTAVMDYQGRNGLQTDGVVGENTWGALQQGAAKWQGGAEQAGLGAPAADGRPTYAAPATPAPTYAGVGTAEPTYTKGQAVAEAESALESHRQNAPGAYQSPYADQIQTMLDDILQRPDFSYDPSADAFYRQYAQQYQQAGQRAMQDTMGQAAALTGGYLSSYAATAGQQAYQRYLQEMNNALPTFSQNAYSRYQAEGDAMRENLALTQGMEEAAYDRHRDDVSDYYTELDVRTDRADTLSHSEYERYLDELAAWRDERDSLERNHQAKLAAWQDERDYGLERYLAELSAWQEDRDLAYRREQDALQQENWLKEYALALAKASGGSGGGGGGGGSRRGAAEEATDSKQNAAVSILRAAATPKALTARDKDNIRKRQSAK